MISTWLFTDLKTILLTEFGFSRWPIKIIFEFFSGYLKGGRGEEGVPVPHVRRPENGAMIALDGNHENLRSMSERASTVPQDTLIFATGCQDGLHLAVKVSQEILFDCISRYCCSSCICGHERFLVYRYSSEFLTNTDKQTE